MSIKNILIRLNIDFSFNIFQMLLLKPLSSELSSKYYPLSKVKKTKDN